MNHRSFLYDLGGEIMDLRHDIDFALRLYNEYNQYPTEKIVERLMEFQNALADYADEQLKMKLPGWEVPIDPWGF